MSKKRVALTLRHPDEADVVVLGHPDAQTSGRTLSRKSGARVTRKTLYLDEELEMQLAMYATKQRTTESIVVGLALKRFLGRE